MTDTTAVPPTPSPFAPPPLPPAAAAPAAPAEENSGPFWWPAPRVFIVGWMMISSFVVIVLCWWKPPAADNQLLNTLVGMYIGTGFIAAINWWMGSSKGSDDKSNAINAQLAKGP